MTLLQNIWTDLKEKRLVPVVGALVVLLIAVPVVLAKSGDSAVGTLPAVGAGTAVGTSKAATLVVSGDPSVRRRAGAGRDPFASSGAPKPKTTAGTTVAAAPTSGTKTTTTGPKDSGGSTGDTSPPKPAAPVATETFRKVDLRFGAGGDTKRIHRDVARLTIYPTPEHPVAVLLGIHTGSRSAIFRLEDGVVHSGEGICRQSAERCRTLELRTGDTAFLEATLEDGSKRSYQLDLLGLPSAALTPAEQQDAIARTSAAGSTYLTKGDRAGARRTQFLPWIWDADTGYLSLLVDDAAKAALPVPEPAG